jgi:hypothetical protein
MGYFWLCGDRSARFNWRVFSVNFDAERDTNTAEIGGYGGKASSVNGGLGLPFSLRLAAKPRGCWKNGGWAGEGGGWNFEEVYGEGGGGNFRKVYDLGSSA